MTDITEKRIERLEEKVDKIMDNELVHLQLKLNSVYLKVNALLWLHGVLATSILAWAVKVLLK